MGVRFRVRLRVRFRVRFKVRFYGRSRVDSRVKVGSRFLIPGQQTKSISAF